MRALHCSHRPAIRGRLAQEPKPARQVRASTKHVGASGRRGSLRRAAGARAGKRLDRGRRRPLQRACVHRARAQAASEPRRGVPGPHRVVLLRPRPRWPPPRGRPRRAWFGDRALTGRPARRTPTSAFPGRVITEPSPPGGGRARVGLAGPAPGPFACIWRAEGRDCKPGAVLGPCFPWYLFCQVKYEKHPTPEVNSLSRSLPCDWRKFAPEHF